MSGRLAKLARSASAATAVCTPQCPSFALRFRPTIKTQTHPSSVASKITTSRPVQPEPKLQAASSISSPLLLAPLHFSALLRTLAESLPHSTEAFSHLKTLHLFLLNPFAFLVVESCTPCRKHCKISISSLVPLQNPHLHSLERERERKRERERERERKRKSEREIMRTTTYRRNSFCLP